ncbi:MAG TPA: ClpXP protease specificity-enhancing factor SspB [Pseudolabrys sp.]|nr:ClpXP protease specificity-enhancing factor SspB [Pseudolabrys sp.]
MADQIRYDLLTQQALRGVVRQVLADAAKKGLPGDHHFYITFDTHADGVRLSDRLRTQYPEEMTIILQHQFWDLTVNEQGFEVGMSFGGIPEKLFIPFAAICGFFDPSVQFGLQFEEIVAGDAKPAAEPSAGKPRLPVAAAPVASVPAITPAAAEAAAEPPKPDKPAGGGEVVRLDRFRKK